MTIAKPRILFFGEGATLAHVTRPMVLASHLNLLLFDVTLALPPAFQWLTTDAAYNVINLECQDSKTFTRRLDRGLPLYDYATLSAYVTNDLALIDSVKPDVIVGDFRLSLSVSARLRSIPYIAICDAYWAPERPLDAPLPVLSFTRFTPIPIAELLFRRASQAAFRRHSTPMERLRAHYGLPSLGLDLRQTYTDADLRLFANFPELFPDVDETFRAKFIGPIIWSPIQVGELPLPDNGASLAYVTMGSSGDTRVLKKIVPILERLDLKIMIATAGRAIPPGLASDRTQVFDYLPGSLVCRHATIVVCNGGSPTTNQALERGVPVLGIPTNMDQFLNMRAINDFGAGLTVRGDRANYKNLSQALEKLINDRRYASRARQLATSAKKHADFGACLTALIGQSAGVSSSANDPKKDPESR